MKTYLLLSAALLGLSLPVCAKAQTPVETIVSRATQNREDGVVLVELRFLNSAKGEQVVALPDRVEAHVDDEGNERSIWLKRDPATPANMVVAPGSFAAARYGIAGETELAGKLISVPAWSTQKIALTELAQTALADASTQQSTQDISPAIAPDSDVSLAAADATLPAPPPIDREANNVFINNLTAYEPIYAVYGPGTNTEARIQISFKYQLFGSHNKRPDFSSSWRDGLHIAYTQRMFWDIRADSYPFRNIDFQPELLYIAPSSTLANGVSVSAMGGLRHESNGQDGDNSRSLNSFYIAPMASVPLGNQTTLTVIPRLAFYLGDKTGNEDIDDYRGHASLEMQVGKENGLRLTTNTRFNFSTGKGALAADLSYPLPNLWAGGPEVYLYGQSFVGYGENMLDYNKRTTRFRVGVAFIR
ncbi:phospholipase [Altererythrobacter indicus]|uniref:Phospholipase A1 n=1 Tax=Altericroceibacterium indicum TaxID=374177 RepID=A0A845AD05_9SPHN|nr:phospholipase A [Altericroceibacterium indicum]MXP25078.1 phospholipase [Altericroceibacterium indicum]